MPEVVRCAVYTRKSTEDGLEQEFNSLDAQREACEAYIASQRSEGWACLRERYDDGGFSGGTLERPALKQLIADVEDGLVDVIVVYKIDRLSRALMDFSKIPGKAPWFDTAMNEIGGEDDVLFERVRAAWGRFAWAQSAPVLEHPPVERVSLTYTLKRAFSYGQAPITLARRDQTKGVAVIVFWMLIGAAKALWHGLQWLGLSLVRHPGRAFQLDRMVRGLAKLAWWVDVRFYGAAALPQKPAMPESRVIESLSQQPEQA